MKMHKLLALVLALVMVLALAACGKDKEADTTTAAPTTAAPTTAAPTTAAPTTAAPTTAAPTTTAPTATPDIQEPTTDETKSVAGKWAYTTDLAAALEGYNGKLEMTMYFNFAADGKATYGIDMDALNASVQANADALKEYLATAGGLKTQEEIDAAFELMLEGFTAESAEEEMGAWTQEGNVLTIEDIVYTVSFDGANLILSGDELEESLGVNEITLTPAN